MGYESVWAIGLSVGYYTVLTVYLHCPAVLDEQGPCLNTYETTLLSNGIR